MKTNLKEPELYYAALNDKQRTKHGLSVTFGLSEKKEDGYKKNPGIENWQKLKANQSAENLKKLYNRRGKANTFYSYITGVGGIVDIDFAWEWPYAMALRHLGERMETRTIRTPNDGYRLLYIVDEPDEELKFKLMPHVEIHGKPGKHLVVYGRAHNEGGVLKEYELIKDLDIRKDNDIIKDMTKFFENLMENCEFLSYPCIAGQLKEKKNELNNEQQICISNLLNHAKLSMEDKVDFFRTCSNFDKRETSYLLNDTKQDKCREIGLSLL